MQADFQATYRTGGLGQRMADDVAEVLLLAGPAKCPVASFFAAFALVAAHTARADDDNFHSHLAPPPGPCSPCPSRAVLSSHSSQVWFCTFRQADLKSSALASPCSVPPGDAVSSYPSLCSALPGFLSPSLPPTADSLHHACLHFTLHGTWLLSP